MVKFNTSSQHHNETEIQCYTVKREAFEGENLHKFRNFTAAHKSFLHEILGMPHPLCDQFNTLQKFSLRNAPFLLIRESFLP